MNEFFKLLSYKMSFFFFLLQVIALHISPDLGECVVISGDRAVVEEVFPEVSQAMMDARTSLPWNHDPKFVIR